MVFSCCFSVHNLRNMVQRHLEQIQLYNKNLLLESPDHSLMQQKSLGIQNGLMQLDYNIAFKFTHQYYVWNG